ncbi:MAG: helix-turn-helix domain-containing protein, partial [Defluviitaleaceae bacterium]|nr:helix-turn-helix domain-containing protein [Defluviitaleaceae bacterium]
MYPFEDYSDPLIPQRVKLMRKSKKLTQYDIADAIASSQAKVSRAEKGYEKYDKDDVENAKAALDIADMPISDYGFKIFKKRLYHWRNLYRNKQTEEAAELQKELANLIKIEPYNMELPT